MRKPLLNQRRPVRLTRPNLLGNVRRPDVLLLSTIQPVTFMLMFLYVFGGAIEQALPPAAAGSYVNWLIPGILAQSAVFGATPTAFGLNQDRATGVIDRFRSLPMARSAVLAGRTLADLLRSAFVLALPLGPASCSDSVGRPASWAWSPRAVWRSSSGTPAPGSPPPSAWAVKNPEAIQAAVDMVVFPLTLLSSVLLPTRTMPG
jgi:hypothetical protein